MFRIYKMASQTFLLNGLGVQPALTEFMWEKKRTHPPTHITLHKKRTGRCSKTARFNDFVVQSPFVGANQAGKLDFLWRIGSMLLSRIFLCGTVLSVRTCISPHIGSDFMYTCVSVLRFSKFSRIE